MEYGHNEASKNWVDKSSTVAPAILGAAAGVFLGDLMHRGARRPVSLALACLGLAALTPAVVGVVKDKVTGPNTRRGSRKTLDNIRGAGAAESGVDLIDGEDVEQLFV